jgi:lipoprotein-anchoring transpeptidase ErfK/SrfK
MHRLAFPALVTTVLTVANAVAAPLELNPQAVASGAAPEAPAVSGSPLPAIAPPMRYAQAQGSSLGGGFIEMLFRGPGGQHAAPPRYQYQPDEAVPSPQSSAPAVPGYRNWQYEADDSGPGGPPPARASLHPSRTTVDPRFQRQEVNYGGKEAPGTVIINTKERLLYLVKANGKALRYGIGVGRPGFTWAGVHRVSQKREWPDWRPPKEMLKRQPNLPRYMPGGPDNPLGARAMYLGSTLYRIHGSNEPWTIGRAVSSGCIRMRNEDVIHLYDQVKLGTKVVVI